MRAVLVDWLIEIHLKFKLRAETLYITINIIDRYLSLYEVEKSKFQLLGVAAMLISSKYEEIYAPEVRDFEYITDKTYSKAKIMKMELDILVALDFDLLWVSPLQFFFRFYHVLGLNQSSKNLNEDKSNNKSENKLLTNKTTNTNLTNKSSNNNKDNKNNKNSDKDIINNCKVYLLANYLMELSLMEYKLMTYSSSMKAATALYIALKLTRTTFKEEIFNKYTGYKDIDLKACIVDMFRVYEYAPKIPIQACYTKYSDCSRLEISKMNFKN